MGTGEIRRLLLHLTGSHSRADDLRLDRLGARDWATLQFLARMHRLQPLLHWLHKNAATIPDAVRDDWREAYRRSAMTALVQQAELRDCFGLLAGSGFEPVALKGAFLAAHAYPEAALRPMRDIDLIFPEEQVIPAFEALRAAGYVLADAPTMPLEDTLRIEKHLPPMIAPRGTPIELHKRLSQPAGRLDLDAPHVDETVLMDRAIEIDGIAYPVPEDMLAHLIVHAVYGHRLDCGPLVLTDIAFLTRNSDMDWSCFWVRAGRQGWEHGAKLLIDLVRDLHGSETIARHATEPGPAPDVIRETVADLMLQRLDTRRSAKVLGALTGGDYRKLWRRMTGRISAGTEGTMVEDRSAAGGKLRWAIGEARRALSDMLSPDVRAQSRNFDTFKRWLRR